MSEEMTTKNLDINAQYYYNIRLMIRNTFMSVDEMTAALEMEPDHSRNPGERDSTPTAMWGMSSWTEGERDFFEEVHEVLVWLDEKREFVARLIAGGGELHAIAHLPGSINIGSSIRAETLALASSLDVTVGVEVFPHLKRPDEKHAAEDGAQP